MLILLFYFYIPSAFSYKVYPFSFVQNIMFFCFVLNCQLLNFSKCFFFSSFFDQLSFSCESELKLLLSFFFVCVIRRNDNNKKCVHKLINLISDSELKKYNKSSFKLLIRKVKGKLQISGFFIGFFFANFFFSSK